MKRICGLQKKAIRHLSKSHYLAHTEPRMKSLEILSINDQYLFQTASLAHDMLNKQCPSNLQNSLNLCTDSHSYSLRSTEETPLEIRESRFKRPEVKLGFSNMAPKTWNSIPSNIREIKNRITFKKKLKLHILEGYAEKLSCSNPLCRDRRFHLH